jgi:sugar O-acyltransferase (sialic acid O-acetyltransferase NeuD family)
VSALLILAAGGHAKVVAETAAAAGAATRIAFLDDRPLNPVLGWPVLGPLEQFLKPSIQEQFPVALVAIGHAATRLHWLAQLQKAGYELPLLIHPSAWVSPSAQIGPGSVVFAHVTVQAQAMVGTGAILNTGCSVDHDAQLDDGVHIGPGARLAGEVHVGARTWIGIGASVIQQVRIGSDVTVGAGAAVVRDLPDGVTAVGVPARALIPT